MFSLRSVSTSPNAPAQEPVQEPVQASDPADFDASADASEAAFLLPVLSPSQPARVSWRWTLLTSLMTWAICLLGYAVLTYFAVLLPNGSSLYHVVTWRALADTWAEWDSRIFYLPLAVHGYQQQYDWQQIFVNFFPAYPGLVHAVWLLTGKHHLVGAALAVSSLGALGAISGVAMLARGEGFSQPQIRLTLLFFVASPLAFFLFAPYPTGLLIGSIAWSLTVARWRTFAARWYVAPLVGFFAPLLHPTGLVLWPVLLLEFVMQHWPLLRHLRHSVKEQIRATMRLLLTGTLTLVAVPDALLLYCAWCRATYGDPLLWLHTQQHWFQHVSRLPWQTVGIIAANWRQMPTASYGQARLLVDVAPLVLATGLLLVVGAVRLWLLLPHRVVKWLPQWLRRYSTSWQPPVSFLLLWLLLLYLCIAQPVVGTIFPDAVLSSGRYLLSVAPIPLVLATWVAQRPSLATWLLVLGLVVNVTLCGLYLNGQWIV